MQDRVATLHAISGLSVQFRREKNENVFEFFSADGNNVKTCFTYPKAKLFAEGVKLGRELIIHPAH